MDNTEQTNRPTSHDTIRWSEEAVTQLEQAPFFIRWYIKRHVERKARGLGHTEITGEFMTSVKNEIMGRNLL